MPGNDIINLAARQMCFNSCINVQFKLKTIRAYRYEDARKLVAVGMAVSCHPRTYMDAPGLPSFQSVTARW
ncbi:hypothetical protein EMIT0324P_90006 [Pseudomonas chlororaphis]